MDRRSPLLMAFFPLLPAFSFFFLYFFVNSPKWCPPTDLLFLSFFRCTVFFVLLFLSWSFATQVSTSRRFMSFVVIGFVHLSSQPLIHSLSAEPFSFPLSPTPSLVVLFWEVLRFCLFGFLSAGFEQPPSFTGIPFSCYSPDLFTSSKESSPPHISDQRFLVPPQSVLALGACLPIFHFVNPLMRPRFGFQPRCFFPSPPLKRSS